MELLGAAAGVRGGPVVWAGLTAAAMLGSGAYVNVACRRNVRKKKSERPTMPKAGVGEVGRGATAKGGRVVWEDEVLEEQRAAGRGGRTRSRSLAQVPPQQQQQQAQQQQKAGKAGAQQGRPSVRAGRTPAASRRSQSAAVPSHGAGAVQVQGRKSVGVPPPKAAAAATAAADMFDDGTGSARVPDLDFNDIFAARLREEGCSASDKRFATPRQEKDPTALGFEEQTGATDPEFKENLMRYLVDASPHRSNGE